MFLTQTNPPRYLTYVACDQNGIAWVHTYVVPTHQTSDEAMAQLLANITWMETW